MLPSNESETYQNQYLPRIFEICIGVFVLLSLIGYSFELLEFILPNPKEINPFKEYYTNHGIEVIFGLNFISRIMFLTMLSLTVLKNNKTKWVTITFLLAAFIIGFLQWFELYYGSTFYYGEVRDKQGLTFPFLASVMFTLIIWKINYSSRKSRDFVAKVMFTALINFGLYILWKAVYEPWYLYQS